MGLLSHSSGRHSRESSPHHNAVRGATTSVADNQTHVNSMSRPPLVTDPGSSHASFQSPPITIHSSPNHTSGSHRRYNLFKRKKQTQSKGGENDNLKLGTSTSDEELDMPSDNVGHPEMFPAHVQHVNQINASLPPVAAATANIPLNQNNADSVQNKGDKGPINKNSDNAILNPSAVLTHPSQFAAISNANDTSPSFISELRIQNHNLQARLTRSEGTVYTLKNQHAEEIATLTNEVQKCKELTKNLEMQLEYEILDNDTQLRIKNEKINDIQDKIIVLEECLDYLCDPNKKTKDCESNYKGQDDNEEANVKNQSPVSKELSMRIKALRNADRDDVQDYDDNLLLFKNLIFSKSFNQIDASPKKLKQIIEIIKNSWALVELKNKKLTEDILKQEQNIAKIKLFTSPAVASCMKDDVDKLEMNESSLTYVELLFEYQKMQQNFCNILKATENKNDVISNLIQDNKELEDRIRVYSEQEILMKEQLNDLKYDLSQALDDMSEKDEKKKIIQTLSEKQNIIYDLSNQIFQLNHERNEFSKKLQEAEQQMFAQSKSAASNASLNSHSHQNSHSYSKFIKNPLGALKKSIKHTGSTKSTSKLTSDSEKNSYAEDPTSFVSNTNLLQTAPHRNSTTGETHGSFVQGQNTFNYTTATNLGEAGGDQIATTTSNLLAILQPAAASSLNQASNPLAGTASTTNLNTAANTVQANSTAPNVTSFNGIETAPGSSVKGGGKRSSHSLSTTNQNPPSPSLRPSASHSSQHMMSPRPNLTANNMSQSYSSSAILNSPNSAKANSSFSNIALHPLPPPILSNRASKIGSTLNNNSQTALMQNFSLSHILRDIEKESTQCADPSLKLQCEKILLITALEQINTKYQQLSRQIGHVNHFDEHQKKVDDMKKNHQEELNNNQTIVQKTLDENRQLIKKINEYKTELNLLQQKYVQVRDDHNEAQVFFQETNKKIKEQNVILTQMVGDAYTTIDKNQILISKIKTQLYNNEKVENIQESILQKQDLMKFNNLNSFLIKEYIPNLSPLPLLSSQKKSHDSKSFKESASLIHTKKMLLKTLVNSQQRKDFEDEKEDAHFKRHNKSSTNFNRATENEFRKNHTDHDEEELPENNIECSVRLHVDESCKSPFVHQENTREKLHDLFLNAASKRPNSSKMQLEHDEQLASADNHHWQVKSNEPDMLLQSDLNEIMLNDGSDRHSNFLNYEIDSNHLDITKYDKVRE